MKKFNEWMETRKGLVNEDSPHSASVHYGRFLGQIMGWDSHGDPKTFGGKITNWMAGGRHRKAQQMGADLYNTISNPAAITNIIKRAESDGVFQTSTFNACYEFVKQVAGKYNPSPVINTPEFQSELLHKILGKCHQNMGLDYTDAEDFYHDVMGTNPAAKKALSVAYDKDPKDLKEWLAQATGAYKPHPEYDQANYHTKYWLIEAQGIVSPFNLIALLVNKSPDKALSLPQNAKEIRNFSVDFAEAYFPNLINKRKAAANQPQQTGGKVDLTSVSDQDRFGTEIDDLVKVLQHFDKNLNVKKGGGTATVKTGGKKNQLINALTGIVGPVALGKPDAGSLLDTLADHTNFFGMNQLLEGEKLD